MPNEHPLEQFDELIDKCDALRLRRLCRSGLKAAMEAKRFAKSHRLLGPYLDACWRMMDYALYCLELESGIDNAMEIIALTESKEKAKKFQNDFGMDQGMYDAARSCISAYSYLAMLQRTVRLNPLGIAFPLDIGPYATEGTPISCAPIQLVLPLIEKVTEITKPEEKEKSP